MASRIEQIIEEIEEYVDSCKFQPLSTTKIVVNKEELEELLRELRLKTPDEIKRYQKIISNKDAILADAQSKADSIIDNATKQTEQIVSEHEIMIQAHQRASAMLNEAQAHAQQILDQAVADANQIRGGAVAYTDNELAMLQNLIDNAISDTENRYAAFMHQLKEHKDVITSNRNQLSQAEMGQQAESGYHEINNVLNEE
jgi:hypothetical protein